MRQFLLVLAACGAGSAQPDAPMGPQRITIGVHGVGVVTSSPSGIACGTCAFPMPSDCPNPAPPSVCEFDFQAGTYISFELAEQQAYFATSCNSPDDPSIKGCAFTVTRPLTLNVQGAEALQ